MRDDVDFQLQIWTAGEMLAYIERGSLGLPDFQRRFEWSTVDVKAFLSTMLGGLPSGAIMVADNSSVKVALRELEGAPPLSSQGFSGKAGSPQVLALLDGQQRLTALFQATSGAGPDEYYVNFDALLAGANVLEDDVVISKKRGRPWARNTKPADYVPYTALRNDRSFFGWVNAEAPRHLIDQYSIVFSEKLSAVDRYRFPVTQLGGMLDLATVAQIFERTNKWGQRLDAFDLLVARLQSGGWSIREAWATAVREYPAISRVFGENGLPSVSAIAVETRSDARRNAVLSLPPGLIESEWHKVVRATNAVANLLIEEGVRRPDLLAYDSLATAMIAAKKSGVSDGLLACYYWYASLNRWHEVGSNTRVVSDFRHLVSGKLDPAMPQEVPAVTELETNTRRSSRALWCAILSSMLTVTPHDLLTGEPITSTDVEMEDLWRLVPLISGGAATETAAEVPARLRTAAQVFALPTSSTKFRRQGLMQALRAREQQPSLWERPIRDDLFSQLLPDDLKDLGALSPRELVFFRAQLVQMTIEGRLRDRMNEIGSPI